MTHSRLGVSTTLVEDLVVANRVLASHGVLDAFGHVSARSDRHPDRYVLAHFLAPELVNEDGLIEYDLNSNPIAPAPPKQYLERYIHGEIYRARPDVMAVVHSHSPSVIPFAASSIPLRPLYHMGAFLGAGAPIFDIAERFGDTDMLVRTSEQGRYLAATLGSSTIALMRGHGFATVGQSIPEAVYRAIYTELNARMQREAIALGGSVKYLTTGEAERADTTNQWGVDKPWKLWKQNLLKQRRDYVKTDETPREIRNEHAQPINRVTSNKRPWPYPNLTEAEIAAYQQRIDQITKRCSPSSGWFHSLDLGNGLFTPGYGTRELLRRQLEYLQFPDDLTGQSFLDLGSWDGFYAFEAEQRGAARVLATDSFCWNGAGWGNKQGFLLAREILGSKVEDMDIDIMDVCPERVGLFDVVFFSGMLYHMRDPIKAIQNAASVCKRYLILETAVGLLEVEEPTMVYLPRVPGQEQSNYWRPNPELINLWLKELGFKKIDHRLFEERGFFNALR